jgi:hypothetical protein
MNVRAPTISGLAKNSWNSVVEITGRIQSRPIVAQFEPRHILANNESYSKFKLVGKVRINTSVLL